MSKRVEFVESLELENTRKGISSKLKRESKAAETSLETFKEIGESLNIAKRLVPHGQFEAWVKHHFDCTRKWSAPLMKLADSWESLKKARLWAQEKGEVLGTNENGVYGALALIKRMERAEASAEEADKPREKRKTASEWKREAEDWQHQAEDLRHERDKLRQELGTARAQIEELKSREWVQHQSENGASSGGKSVDPTDGQVASATGHMHVPSPANVQSTGHLNQDLSSHESPPAMDGVASFGDVQDDTAEHEADELLEDTA
jgi:hypothetical protein